MRASQFFAGAARTDTTPVRGSIIGVDFFPHYARFVHDRLYARALVLQRGATTLVVVVVDVCIMPSDFLAATKRLITEATGIPPAAILLSATHTHGAGDVAGLLGGAVDIAYRQLLPARIADSVVRALTKLQPARVARGSVRMEAPYQRCRRYLMREDYAAINPVTGVRESVKTNPFGGEAAIIAPAAPVDPELPFLAVQSTGGAWISVLANFSMHYAGDWDVDTLTADYYGAFEKHLRNHLGLDNTFVALLSYGCGGDVNTWDFSGGDAGERPFEKTERIAEDLARGVAARALGLDWQSAPTLDCAYRELEVAVRKPAPDELERATKLLQAHRFADLRVDDHGMRMIYAREQLLLAAYPDRHRAGIQALRIGDQYIGALGGEYFSETGLWLKAQLGDRDFFAVCLANTYDGYVPPPAAFDRGGYETWRARSSFLAPETEPFVRQQLLDLTHSLTTH